MDTPDTLSRPGDEAGDSGTEAEPDGVEEDQADVDPIEVLKQFAERQGVQGHARLVR
jgi:hypothetical protein